MNTIPDHLQGPFGLSAVPSCDLHDIRYINADLGEGKPYTAIATVRHVPELSLEENLASARLLAAAPVLRDAILAQLDPSVDRSLAERKMREALYEASYH